MRMRGPKWLIACWQLLKGPAETGCKLLLRSHRDNNLFTYVDTAPSWEIASAELRASTLPEPCAGGPLCISFDFLFLGYHFMKPPVPRTYSS